MLPLKDLAYGGDYATRTLPLIDPTNGKPTGQLTFEVCLMSALEASLIEEHTVMEYQRWDPVDGWGEKLVLTDPGRWSTANGTRFEKDFDAIVPAIPEGWVVTKAWTTLSTSENVMGGSMLHRLTPWIGIPRRLVGQAIYAGALGFVRCARMSPSLPSPLRMGRSDGIFPSRMGGGAVGGSISAAVGTATPARKSG